MQNLEKPKFKHNKKRNTAFLFESLVKELTKAAINGDKDKQKSLSILIKEHFKKNSILDKELTLYKQIYETKKFPKDHAERLLKEIKDQHEKLNEEEVFNEQSKLIAKLNKFFGPVIYDNFLPNYKTLATISQIFNKSVEPKKKVLLENEIIEYITGEEEEKIALQPLDKLTMNKFIEKFNEAYSNTLLPQQKLLLSKYINGGDEYIDLKIFLNEEVNRLKKELKQIKSADLVKENEELQNKIEKLISSLSKFKIETINEELIKKTMLIQEFVEEVKK